MRKIEIYCDLCREEVTNLDPSHIKIHGGMRVVAVGCINAFIKRKKS